MCSELKPCRFIIATRSTECLIAQSIEEGWPIVTADHLVLALPG